MLMNQENNDDIVWLILAGVLCGLLAVMFLTGLHS